MTKKKQRIGQYLLEKGLISQVALDTALEEQKVTHERIGLILVRNQCLTRQQLLDAILYLNPDAIQGEQYITARVPAEKLIETQSMIVAEKPDAVYVSTLGSEAQARVELAPFYPEAPIVFVAANHEQIDNYLDDLKSMNSSEDSLVDKLLRRAFTEEASDIHIIPRYSSYSVFFRIMGVRHHRHEGPLDEYNTLCARLKDLARMDLAERRIPQDGAFSTEFNGKMVDLRVAALPINNAEYMVLRLLDPSRVQPSLTGLGITRVDEWRKGVSRPDGLALICGPTGSGKTTTLNASLKELDRYGSSIFTVEDPVEYRLPYLGQMNANPAVGLDFARAIRAFMRSDPDVIVLGELRDSETARNAIKSAETGHLTIGTLHTGSIKGAVQRLRDLGVPANELTYVLRVVMVQRLLRTTCNHCKGEGCVVCSGTGYGGRTVVSEVQYFPDDVAVTRLFNEEAWWPTLIDDAILKLEMGVTNEKEVIRVFGEEARTRIHGRKGAA
jgi:type II secretory ATPase GspE/PulE/Tfp pilus assembly ATPase PilB-like protein